MPQRYTYNVTGEFGSEIGTVTDNHTGEVVRRWKGFGPGHICVRVACVNEVQYLMGRFSPAAREHWLIQRDK